MPADSGGSGAAGAIRPSGTAAYRGDVDGLRALAVALVILYHLRVPGIGAGFVGVDVFFVISGFVVTRVLGPRAQAGTFSFKQFYVNRFWRLQPAFFLVAAVTLASSLFLLAPVDQLRAAQSAGAALTLCANFFFWSSAAEYGSPLAEQLPLLHTWSLAVEEQFYLLWPLILVFAYRFRWLLRPAVGVSVLLVLIGVSELLARTEPSTAYYLLPARLFELGLGAAIVPLEVRPPSRRLAFVLWTCGLGAIAASAVFLNDHSPFPGLNALVPCLGAALMIHAGATPHLCHRALDNRPLRAIGQASYSLYLWHWPPIAFANYVGLAFTPLLRFELGGGALALALLTFRYWETPTRRSAPLVHRLTTFGLAGLLLVAVGFVVRPGSGPQRAAQAGAEFESDETQRHLECLFDARNWKAVDRCGKVKPARRGSKRVLIWGDSHARVYGMALAQRAAKSSWVPTVLWLSGCPPLFGIHRRDTSALAQACNVALGRRVERFIQQHEFDAILLVGRFSLYEKGWIRNGKLRSTTHFLSNASIEGVDAEHSARVLRLGLIETVERLVTMSRARILFALPTPNLPQTPERYKKHDLAVSRKAYLADRKFVDDLARELPQQVTVFDPVDAICGPSECPAWSPKGWLYRDDTHLSPLGQAKLRPWIVRAFERAFERAPGKMPVETPAGH